MEENKDILDNPNNQKAVEHKITYSINSITLGGIFAWIFYAQVVLWIIKGILVIIKDIVLLING